MKGSARSHEWHRFSPSLAFFRAPSAPPLSAPTSTVVSISSPCSKGRHGRHPQHQTPLLHCFPLHRHRRPPCDRPLGPRLSPCVRTQLSTPMRISVCASPLAHHAAIRTCSSTAMDSAHDDDTFVFCSPYPPLLFPFPMDSTSNR